MRGSSLVNSSYSWVDRILTIDLLKFKLTYELSVDDDDDDGDDDGDDMHTESLISGTLQ